MKIYIATNTAIFDFDDTAPADLLIDEIVDIAQDNSTCAMNDLQIAKARLTSGKSQHLYCFEIKKVEK